MDNREISNLINSQKKKIRILVDASNLFYRSIFVLDKKLQEPGYSDFRLFKYKVINSIIDFSTYFDHPEIWLCFDKKDNGRYWKNDIFEYYKANRDNSKFPIPKDIVYKEFLNIEEDISENLPWKVIKVTGVEADDIISIVCKNYKNDINVIYSPDKDFVQLQSGNSVFQFDPMKKIFLDEKSPKKFLFEHVIRGDSSDGIPNILSDEDAIINITKKQKPIRSTKIAEMWDVNINKGLKECRDEFFTESMKERFIINRKMIDLSKIPGYIEELIMTTIKNTKIKGDRTKFWNWCVKTNQRKLSEKAMILQ